MRPQAHAAEEHGTCHFSLVVNRYLNYILIRTLAYTNNRAAAERIAAYTLITSCLLSRRLGRLADLGLVIETMVQMVGDDQAGAGELRIGDFGLRIETPAFVLDDRMCDVAGAINSVGRFGRELLVLHHVEGISVAALAQFQAMPVERIETALADAEGEFVEILRGLGWDLVGATPCGCPGSSMDVHTILVELAGCLDEECRKDVADCVLHYLATHRPWP